MVKEIRIVPAILEGSIEAVQEKVDRLKGLTERVGIDIIDGIFADNLTLGIGDLALVEFHGMKVEVQLMTEYPTELLGECQASGVERVFGQIERMGQVEDFLAVAGEMRLKAGLGLDLFTPSQRVEKQWWPEIDGVLLMGVKAGFSGQEFNPRVLDKIRELRRRGYEGAIQVDGGMEPETMKACIAAGADEFSVTSYLWQAEDPSQALADLKRVV